MNSQHNIGPRDHEILVATFEVRSAEIRGGEILLLQHGAHRAIQDQDALTEKFAEGQALLDQVSHVLGIIPCEKPRGEAALRNLLPGMEHLPAAGPRETFETILIAKIVKNVHSPCLFTISATKLRVNSELESARAATKPLRKEIPA